MTLKRFCLIGPAALVYGTVLAGPATANSRPPNFILIMADDLGYGDLAKQFPPNP